MIIFTIAFSLFTTAPKMNPQLEYKPKISKDKAITITNDFLKQNLIKGYDSPTVVLFDPKSEFSFPVWQVSFSTFVKCEVNAEYGYVQNFTYTQREDALIAGMRMNLGFKIPKDQSATYGLSIAKKNGAPSDCSIVYNKFKDSGQRAPSVQIQVDTKPGGYSFYSANPWAVLFYDPTDGQLFSYTRFLEKRINSSAFTISKEDATATANRAYSEFMERKKIVKRKRLTSTCTGYVPSDFGFEVDAFDKPVRGIRQFRLGWLFDYSGDYVAVDGSSGKVLSLSVNMRG